MIKLNILTAKEVGQKIGKSERRVQELINEGKVFPRLIIQDGSVRRVGVRPEVLKSYLRTRSGR